MGVFLCLLIILFGWFDRKRVPHVAIVEINTVLPYRKPKRYPYPVQSLKFLEEYMQFACITRRIALPWIWKLAVAVVPASPDTNHWSVLIGWVSDYNLKHIVCNMHTLIYPRYLDIANSCKDKMGGYSVKQNRKEKKEDINWFIPIKLSSFRDRRIPILTKSRGDEVRKAGILGRCFSRKS